MWVKTKTYTSGRLVRSFVYAITLSGLVFLVVDFLHWLFQYPIALICFSLPITWFLYKRHEVTLDVWIDDPYDPSEIVNDRDTTRRV